MHQNVAGRLRSAAKKMPAFRATRVVMWQTIENHSGGPCRRHAWITARQSATCVTPSAGSGLGARRGIAGADSEAETSSMLKVDLHSHTADDPIDWIPHSSTELIDRAATLGYDALAITLHERQLDTRRLTAYAAERGIVLIPGIERTIQGRHVLLLNFRNGAEEVRTFEDLARLKRRLPGLVVAPHPFFPASI